MKRYTFRPVAKAGTALMTAAMLFSAPASSLLSMAAETDTETTTATTTVSSSSSITMSTDFPGTSVEAGDSISFSIDFSNTGSGELFSLSTSDLPEGFEGYFQGNSHTVSSVYVQNGTSESLLTYIITIPETAEDGDYDIVLYADSDSRSASLTLTLTVSELDLGVSTFTTDYENQEGSAGSSFTFETTLTNNTIADQTYTLTADAPDGWLVYFTADDGSTRVTSIDVGGISSSDPTITVTVPEGEETGDYAITVTAESEDETHVLYLTVTVTGTYDISLTTQNSTVSFDVKTNQETSVILEITNNGNVALTDINLSASTPTDWSVEFSESTIESLEGGATKQVTAYVTPSDSAISGDYVITMTAAAEETSYTASFRVTAETQTIWGVVGVVIIIAILACLAVVFKKFGRH